MQTRVRRGRGRHGCGQAGGQAGLGPAQRAPPRRPRWRSAGRWAPVTSWSYTSPVTLTDQCRRLGGEPGRRRRREHLRADHPRLPALARSHPGHPRADHRQGRRHRRRPGTGRRRRHRTLTDADPNNPASLVKQVAKLTGVEAAPLAKAVAAASPNAFVPVITLRESDYQKVADKLQPLKGTVFRTRTQSLGLTRDFARALLGTVGPVTAEIVSGSGNRYQAGDFAGVSGLERQYDARLAGGSSYTVAEVPKDPASGTLERHASSIPMRRPVNRSPRRWTRRRRRPPMRRWPTSRCPARSSRWTSRPARCSPSPTPRATA